MNIRNDIPCVRVPELEGDNSHCMFVRVALPGLPTPTLVALVYRRAADPDSTKKLLQCIGDATLRNLPMLIVGDMNARHTDWCTKTDSNGRALADFCAEAGLTILNSIHSPQQPTYSSAGRTSTIDLFITSHPSLFNSLCPMPSLALTSDHFPVVATSPVINVDPASSPTYFRWRTEDANWQLFSDIQTDRSDSFLPAFFTAC